MGGTKHGNPMVSEVEVGQIVGGKYRIESLLGVGGMATVFAATHLELDERVAIKILRPDAARNETTVKRFAREARAAAKIQGEHVVHVLDVGRLETGAPYLVMELFEGVDLGAYAANAKRPLGVEQVVDFTLQALRGIAEAHAIGIVHRDIKPANLFVTHRRNGSSCIKVLDFGIAKTQADPSVALTRASTIVGSPAFMAPEQWLAFDDVDVRADVWAIGAVMFRLLTGRQPFQGSSIPQLCAAVLEAEPLSLRELRSDVPVALERVILRCLAKERAARFQNVGELAHALARFAPAGARASIESIAATVGWSAPDVDEEITLEMPKSTRPVPERASRSVDRPARWQRIIERRVAGLVALVAFALSVGLIIRNWESTPIAYRGVTASVAGRGEPSRMDSAARVAVDAAGETVVPAAHATTALSARPFRAAATRGELAGRL